MQSTKQNDRRFTAEMTLTDLVQQDYRLSSVFDHHGLNYCCEGARTLSQACAEKNIDANEVLSEMTQLAREERTSSPATDSNLRDLLTLLYEEYEPKLQAMLLPAEAKLHKVAGSHGDDFSETIAAAETMDQMTDELVSHLSRGKEVLAPRVKEILSLSDQSQDERARSASLALRHLLHELKAENRVVQRYLFEIRELTSRYKAPEGACMTFAVCYQELAEFDQALSQFLETEEEVFLPQLFTDPSNWR